MVRYPDFGINDMARRSKPNGQLTQAFDGYLEQSLGLKPSCSKLTRLARNFEQKIVVSLKTDADLAGDDVIHTMMHEVSESTIESKQSFRMLAYVEMRLTTDATVLIYHAIAHKADSNDETFDSHESRRED